MKTHLIIGLDENLVVFTQGHQKHDGRHILKTMDPLPSF